MEKRNWVEESRDTTFEPCTQENAYSDYDFIKMPKAVTFNPNISPVAKLVYQILLDRQIASMYNESKFLNEYGYYVIYRRAELAKVMNVSESTIKRAFTELKKNGLIEVDKTPRGSPQIIYVCKPSM